MAWKNPEEHAAYERRRRQTPEYRDWSRNYQNKIRRHKAEWKRGYRARNVEKIRQQNRESKERRKPTVTPERHAQLSEYGRVWYERNRELISAKRIARKLGVPLDRAVEMRKVQGLLREASRLVQSKL